MKTILCFGDSNTWGFDPATQGRFGFDVRWPGVLRAELAGSCHIIEEGLSGRTTVWEDPIFRGRSGRDYLAPCLDSHEPLDLVVILLGTNDLKKRFSAAAIDIARAVGTLVDMTQRGANGAGGSVPEVLLIAPPPLARLSDFADTFEGGYAKSEKLGRLYQDIARDQRCHFLDAGHIIRSSDIDGIHWEAPEHAKLGRAVAEFARGILGL